MSSLGFNALNCSLSSSSQRDTLLWENAQMIPVQIEHLSPLDEKYTWFACLESASSVGAVGPQFTSLTNG